MGEHHRGLVEINSKKMDEQINISLTVNDLMLIHEGLGYLPFRQVEKLINQIRQILQTTLQNKEPQ